MQVRSGAARILAGAAALATFVLAPLARAAEVKSESNIELTKAAQDILTGKAIFYGTTGFHLLAAGLILCVLGLVLSLAFYVRLKGLPVHRAMKEISELIYGTCRTYLLQQGKFILMLWAFIGVIMIAYFGFLSVPHKSAADVVVILLFSLLGISGSYGVAWFGIRVNTFANSRSCFASLKGKPYPTYAIPAEAGMSIGMALVSVELIMMMFIFLFMRNIAGDCFIGFAIGESLGAAALRIAGGIFTKIADVGSDLMKIVFNIKEDDARNPGVIADCTGDNAGDSVGPTADGFETYGVTGVALIVFILLAVQDPTIQIQLLVWIFVMRLMMLITSALAFFVNQAIAKAIHGASDSMNFESPLTSLVWITSLISIGATFLVTYFLIPDVGGDTNLWWQLSAIVSCGTLAGALIPEVVKVFTSTKAIHVREVLAASREGGASLNILAGLVAGDFSAFWMGIVFLALMGGAYGLSTLGLGHIMPPEGAEAAAAVFSFGLVAFGFLGMGPVTIAVDSYGPVTDNAQSVYELSLIESVPNVKAEVKKEFGFDLSFDKAKHFLEENDGAGNTFKATAKPVLIGTAVVGATTMIFAIIVSLTSSAAFPNGFDPKLIANLSLVHAPFLLGLLAGGAVIYWFTGASTQAVSTGAYRAVEYIKAHIKLEGVEKASQKDSNAVVKICTQYAQKGMWNIFLTVFFATLAFACLDQFFFIGYLISIAFFGLYQAVFMANAGGAWDNAKKLVEVELQEKGTALHAATVVGDTVGDPFKDTSSVAMNPVIKFTTLFGLLAVELAVKMPRVWRSGLFVVFFIVAAIFVLRSFYGMRIKQDAKAAAVKSGSTAAA